MKKLSLLLFSSLLFVSCSSDDSSSDDNNQTPAYAMTASIDGADFRANNPFGNNMFSSTNIWDYFPEEDFVMLQGRSGGVLGNPEINIWLKRSDIEVGTYALEPETFSTPSTHAIDLTDNSDNEFEYTKDGTIVITAVNTTTKMVTGTFTFRTVADPNEPTAPVTRTITNGTFNYKYEE
ncbi:hypothetical protein FLJC2902T_01330 [Flavobacterium limnosediminis JC2902]|uniref:Lipocalin-like domain-containing protein n=1 Tax=Flavobacterium limnosediminis JC2902 TaxID=1341181 RepID=V6SZ42_9FLAO|nr:DUF6252 family protein [Flavobacterium limnosediminis]ESU29660.1 hypothetical protein FLJC2902T_01330 [Flavobacterium limnosediminis JC2902]